MPKIIDYSRGEEGESVGKIEDTGSFTTQDSLLEGLLEDYVENGVETLLPEYSENGVNYGLGVVESGNKGFARCVIQHLPSPYYAESEEILSLDDYSVKEVKTDSDDNPLTGKQGMDTVSHFTALSSESSDPSRERVDAPWNEIDDEENLPESAKTNKSKSRQYVDSPDEAPDYANVQEGEEPGVYWYETDESQNDTSNDEEYWPVDFAPNQSAKDMEEHQYWAMSQLKKNHGEEMTDQLKNQMDVWKTDGYNNRSFFSIWKAVGDITGNQQMPSNLERYEDSDNIFQGSEEYTSMIQDMINLNQKSIRDSFGDEITVYRGYDQSTIEECFAPHDDGYEIDPLPLESWTLDQEVAERFTDAYGDGGAVIKSTMSPENFAIATQIMEPSTGFEFQELTAMREGSYTITEDNIVQGDINKDENVQTLSGDQSDWIQYLREKEQVKKTRIYINDPSDAPEDASIEEGPEGGLYYEVESETEDSGDILDDILDSMGDMGPDESETEDREVMTEEEQQEHYREVINDLPVEPPKNPDDEKAGISVDNDDFYEGTNTQGQDKVAEILEDPEFLGVPMQLSTVDDESDYGPFDNSTDIPVYDEGKYSSIDVQMDTEDFALVQQRINEEFFDSDWESHFGSSRSEDIEQYSDVLENEPGEMPMPYIVVNENGEVTSTQEGRHRSLAAMHAGIEDIPVRIAIEPGRKGKSIKHNKKNNIFIL